MPTSGRDPRGWRPFPGGVHLAAVALLGAALLSAPAAAGVSADVEDLLWNLQIVPLDGDPPSFTLPGLDGTSRSLSGAKGRVVLLYFWATW